jgi:aldose 1-epimerase
VTLPSAPRILRHAFAALIVLGGVCAVAPEGAAEEIEPVELRSERFRVVVSPARGGSLLAMRVKRGEAWLDLMPDPGSRGASWLMLPYSNRIRDGRFVFDRREHQLTGARNHAIHGDVRTRPWRIVEQTPSSLVLAFDSAEFPDFNWPWPVHATVGIRLSGDRVEQTLRLENRGKTTMPAGFGWHPYYRRWLSREGEPVVLGFTAPRIHPDTDADGLPDGPPEPVPADLDFSTPRELGSRRIDACFAGFDGQATIQWPESGVTLTYACSPNVTHLICFGPEDRPVLAIEPAANANDGVNRLAAGEADSGVIPLPAGDVLEASFTISAQVR